MKNTTKEIKVELVFEGNGKVVKNKSGSYSGGVPIPQIKKHSSFYVYREVIDEDGILNPVMGEAGVAGAFQVNIIGDSKMFREWGKFLLSLAELDTTVDKGFHKHVQDLKSADGRTQLHIIFRKDRM